jgi:hypothetical protein
LVVGLKADPRLFPGSEPLRQMFDEGMLVVWKTWWQQEGRAIYDPSLKNPPH